MNQEALKAIKLVINEWRAERRYPYENKQCYAWAALTSPGEYLLKFSNSIYLTNIKGKTDEIVKLSEGFLTTTLSENSFSENHLADKYRLEQFLKDFDERYYEEANRKIENVHDDLLDTIEWF